MRISCTNKRPKTLHKTLREPNMIPKGSPNDRQIRQFHYLCPSWAHLAANECPEAPTGAKSAPTSNRKGANIRMIFAYFRASPYVEKSFQVHSGSLLNSISFWKRFWNLMVHNFHAKNFDVWVPQVQLLLSYRTLFFKLMPLLETSRKPLWKPTWPQRRPLERPRAAQDGPQEVPKSPQYRAPKSPRTLKMTPK